MCKVTGEEVQAAMIKAGITRVDHHKCGACNYMVKYLREGDQLFFDSSCLCSSSALQPRAWDDAAEWINMQSNPGVSEKLALQFGVVLSDNG